MVDKRKIERDYDNLLTLNRLELMAYWLTSKVEKQHPAPMPIEVHGAWDNHGKFWPSEATYKVLLKDIKSQIRKLKKELDG